MRRILCPDTVLHGRAVACQMSAEELQFTILRTLDQRPHSTQRQLASEMDVSLGKVNYCLKKLAEKGLIKLHNFQNSKQKSAYLYLLTPKGIEEKSRLTFSFLKQKTEEYDRLKQEIDQLQKEMFSHSAQGIIDLE